MARQTLNLGTAANDGTGDDLRTGGQKINDNFAELYAGLGLWDRWTEAHFSGTSAFAPMWAGTAIASGSNLGNPPASTVTGIARYGQLLRSSVNANSGYRYITGSFTADYFGQISHKFRCQGQPATGLTNRLVRIGYLDTVDQNDAADGAYFEISGAICSAKTASNSVRTTAATTLTLTLGTFYTFDIEVNAAGTSARFRVWAGINTTPVFDQTITTNLPTTPSRVFGCGIVATSNNLVAEDIFVLYALGEGTIAGFLRAKGGW